MDEQTYYLGFGVKKSKKGTILSQSKNTRDLIKRFIFNNYKSINIPMSSSTHLDKDPLRKLVNPKRY